MKAVDRQTANESKRERLQVGETACRINDWMMDEAGRRQAQIQGQVDTRQRRLRWR